MRPAAVKHFQPERRGKPRIHQRPTTAEVNACHPWLEAELEAVDSPVLVALGAIAAQALFEALGIAASRSRPFDLGDRIAFITYHPSAVLRGDERADEIRGALIGDLTLAGPGLVDSGPRGSAMTVAPTSTTAPAARPAGGSRRSPRLTPRPACSATSRNGGRERSPIWLAASRSVTLSIPH